MKPAGVFVRFPQYPFEPSCLIPDWRLAFLAGCLKDAGHIAEVLDYGTVEMLERLFPASPCTEAADRAEPLLGESPPSKRGGLAAWWRWRRDERALLQSRDAVCREIARQLLSRKGLQFVAFKLDEVGALSSSIAIAKSVRDANPEIVLIGTGRLAERCGAILLSKHSPLDVLLAEEPEAAIVPLAESIRNPLFWRHLPNLMYKSGGTIVRSSHRAALSSDSLPLAAYEPAFYPALQGPGKLKLFVVEESRGAWQLPVDRDSPGGNWEPATGNRQRAKPVRAILSEVSRLGALFGAQAFHFHDAKPFPARLRALTCELLARGAQLLYSRTAAISGFDASLLRLLKSSGCHAIGYTIHTGSQRLLEDYYHCDFGVTQTEKLLRASETAGIYTVAHLDYPCPFDDYHTRAETLRVVDRAKPSAAPVRMPEWGLARAVARAMKRSEYHYPGPRPPARFVGGPTPVPALPSAVDHVPPGGPWREHCALVRELEMRSVAASVFEEGALVAALCGHEGRERDFARHVSRLFLAGDIAGIGAMVDTFNASACVPAARVSAWLSHRNQTAVGN